jgi:histidinol-phosphate aminotransferase
MVARLNATRERLAQRLTELNFHVTPSHANFVWCTEPEGRHQELHAFLKRHQVLIRYMDFPGWGDGLRISVGTDEQVDACLMLIERFLASSPAAPAQP